MKNYELKTLIKFALPLTIITFIIFILFNNYLNPFKGFENKWFDFKFSGPKILSIINENLYEKWNIHKKADPKISIIAIDDFSTEKYGWPFKRKYYAQIIDKLEKLKVKVIGFDVLFLDADKSNPENDRIFIEGLKRNKNTVNLVLVDPMAGKIKYPINGIMQNSFYMAQPNADLNLDDDGHIRKFYLFYPTLINEKGQEYNVYYDELYKHNARKCKSCEGITIPLLATSIYSIYSKEPLDDLYKKWKDEEISLNFRTPQNRIRHKGRKDKKEIYYASYRHISVRDLLEDKLSDEEKESLREGIAIIGSTAVGAFDHYPTPFMKLAPGVEFHANIIDNLIHKDYLKEVGFLFKTIILLLVVWIPILFYKKSIKFISIISFLLALILMFLSMDLLRIKYNFNCASYLFTLIFSYVYVVAYKSIVEGKEKKWIKNTFSQYLSHKVVNALVEDPSKLKLGGEKRDMTVLFLDIAHFTTISEKMTPEELTHFLMIYLSELTEVIHKYDGVVDKYIGDCIMAFWNAPIDQTAHRTLACKAGLECIKKVEELNLNSKNDEKPSIRIGINSGYMTVGNMGSNTRFSYTVLGDNVNLASRLEGANKFFGSKIMITENVMQESKEEIKARFLGNIKVVGKDIAVKVYEPICLKKDLNKDLENFFSNYEKGIELFYLNKYEEAIIYFEKVIKDFKFDGPSEFYIKISKEYINKKENFEGVFNLTSK